MKSGFRPPAVPLVTVDPYFSVWSMADRLTDDYTRHWTGQRNALTGLIRVDGEPYRFAGRVEPSAERYYTEPAAMEQTGLEVTALTTAYRFEGGGVALEVNFTTPLLLEDLEVLSRPASYIQFTVRSLDGRPHRVQLYLDVTGEWCVDRSDQRVVWQTNENPSGLDIVRMSHETQDYLNRSGDDLRIDWGALYLAVQAAESASVFAGSAGLRKQFVREGRIDDPHAHGISQPRSVRDGYPVLGQLWDCGEVGTEALSRLVVLAYDDVYAIEYFGEKLQAYWKKSGTTVPAMLEAAFAEAPDLLRRCRLFDQRLREEAARSGGEKYADLLALAYRQAIAAHKLVTGPDGESLFMSKECYSNGCIATVDVSYPSIPLFLLYQPELVRGMMRPIFKYAASEAWPFEFAPHDVGQYPLANGQVYAENKLEGQMPVEECGNMLIMAAAVGLAERRLDWLDPYRPLLKRWADYLCEHGLDPENQLCTDDFAGHLARNANLSIKAAMGVAGYAILLELQGHHSESEHYLETAREMAVKWAELAEEGDHSKLAFGQDGTWSLKYNLIWDQIFETRIFDEEIARTETAWYAKTQNGYGVPLDSRETYTKADWLVWAAALTSEREAFIDLVEPLWKALHETKDRVPFTDWYDTKSARQLNFQHRSVVGGIFIKLLKDRGFKR